MWKLSLPASSCGLNVGPFRLKASSACPCQKPFFPPRLDKSSRQRSLFLFHVGWRESWTRCVIHNDSDLRRPAASPSRTLLTSPQHNTYAVRNREHQRRSRARRMEYVSNLEARVRKYDQDGVRVTAEVQVAARRVAEENHLLRVLLGMHGISAAAIDHHLASSRHVSAATSLSAITPSLNSHTRHPIAAKQSTPSGMSRPNQQVTHVPTQSASQSPIDESRIRSSPEDSRPMTCERQTSVQSSDVPGKVSRSEPADETSCESAARIIASMRGHEDPGAFWPALGCSDTDVCMVKNIKIFQLADGYDANLS